MFPVRTCLLVAALVLVGGDRSSASPARVAELDFDAGGRPTIAVLVNGEHEYHFAVDTAAQRTMLGYRLVEALDLVPDPENRAQAHGAGGVQTLDMYALGSLEAAGKTTENGLYMAAQKGGHAAGGEHDGVLGQEFFAGTKLTLDFESRSMEVGEIPDDTLGRIQSTLGAELVFGGFVWVEIEVDGVPTAALIDTGASESFGNPVLMRELGVEIGRDGVESRDRTVGVTQSRQELVEGYRAEYALGATKVGDAPLDFLDSPVFATFGRDKTPAMVLGMDVLGRLPGLVVDYEAKFLHVLQNSPSGPVH